MSCGLLTKKNLPFLVGCLSMVVLLAPWRACAGSCLPAKLARRVKAAGSVYGRLETYVAIGRRQSSELGGCLAFYRPLDDSFFSLTRCNPQVPLDILECAWTEMQREMATWHPTRSAGRAQLANLRSEVAKAYESYQRAVESHPTFLESTINRIRWMIEDVEADLARMAQNRSLGPGAAP
jgi:hypothetical protein